MSKQLLSLRELVNESLSVLDRFLIGDCPHPYNFLMPTHLMWAAGMLAQRVLLVSEDRELHATLETLLERVGSALWQRDHVSPAERLLARRRFYLLLLDLRSSGANPVDATLKLRQCSSDALIVLGEPRVESDAQALFEAGADDLLTLPLESQALLGKLKILSQSGIQARDRDGGSRKRGALRVDREAQALRCQGRLVHVTPTELKLLQRLLASPGRFVSHRRLLIDVWGSSSLHRLEQLQKKMRQLRRKLDAIRQCLVVEPALGYSLLALPA